MSFVGREWSFRRSSWDLGLGDLRSRFLAARGLTGARAETFVAPPPAGILPDPWIFPNMRDLCGRLARACAGGEMIGVFGDYDVDGACASAIVATVLGELGCRVRCHIPDRVAEGYGPNAAALGRMAEAGCSVILCVDCGSSAQSVFRDFAQLHPLVDVLVLDHHRVSSRVDVFAAVNPNAPGGECGMGSVCAGFLALVAMDGLCRIVPSGAAVDVMDLVDLAALATVCDVMPLVGLNRDVVRVGVSRMREAARPGIAALARVAGVEPASISSKTLGFGIGPRINAGGRIGRADAGLEILLRRDYDQAWADATAMDAVNRERMTVGHDVLDAAVSLAREQVEAGLPVIVVGSADWHVGIVGIVAGRLREQFNRPAMVAGMSGSQGATAVMKGSGRSVPGFDLGSAVIEACADGVLAGGGGHAMAAGFALSPGRLDDLAGWFAERFPELALRPRQAVLEIDCWIDPVELDVGSFDALQAVEPFGNGFTAPVLCLEGVFVRGAKMVGRNADTLSFLAVLPGRSAMAEIRCVVFGAARSGLADGLLSVGSGRVDLAGELSVNEWRGERRLEFRVHDARLSEVDVPSG